MTDLMATRGAECIDEDSGVSGTVSQFQDTNISVTVTNSDGNAAQLGTKETSNMSFDDGDKELPDDSETSQSVTVNESFIFLVRDNVYTNHDILDGGTNNSVTYSSSQ